MMYVRNAPSLPAPVCGYPSFFSFSISILGFRIKAIENTHSLFIGADSRQSMEWQKQTYKKKITKTEAPKNPKVEPNWKHKQNLNNANWILRILHSRSTYTIPFHTLLYTTTYTLFTLHSGALCATVIIVPWSDLRFLSLYFSSPNIYIILYLAMNYRQTFTLFVRIILKWVSLGSNTKSNAGFFRNAFVMEWYGWLFFLCQLTRSYLGKMTV